MNQPSDSNLQSIECERHSLSGLCKFPVILPEIDLWVKPEDFTNSTHQTIFLSLRQLILKNQKPDKVLLANTISSTGIKFKDDIDIYSYIESLFLSQITKEASVLAFKQLLNYRIRREIVDVCRKMAMYAKQHGESVDEVISWCDKTYGDTIKTFRLSDEPIDLYAELVDLIESRGNNPIEETGIITPFKEFNRLFGGLRAGNGIYSIIARPKMGKSTYLLALAEGVVLNNPNCKVLIADTEMQTEVNQLRIAAAKSTVPIWFLETGQWRKCNAYVDKFRNKVPELNSKKGSVYHIKVANKPIHQVLAIARRWYYKHVGIGNPCLFIYDYIKLTGEKLSDFYKEYQAVGDKINYLNDFGTDLNVPIFTAMQQNREAETGKDNSATASQSDRLQWFCAFNGILRRKTLEELGRYGLEWGSHMLIPLAQRFQGKEGAGFRDLVNISTDKKPKYVENFINYNIENFKVEERGTLHDTAEKMKEQYEIQKEQEKDGKDSELSL